MRPFTTPTSLGKLCELLPGSQLFFDEIGRIEGIALDSRSVQSGDLFVALPGTQMDGHRFAAKAVESGAVAVMGEDHTLAIQGRPYLQVANAHDALARVASHIYGDPSRAIPLIGVTGTNGKTTITYLLEAILTLGMGQSPLVVGTVNYRQGNWVQPATHTTPDAIRVQSLLAERLMRGATHGILEVSSHALEQRRADGLHFDVAIFASFSRDHLDYHETMEAYFEAKARLFETLLLEKGKGAKVAVLGVDNPQVAALAKRLQGRLSLVRYALEEGPDRDLYLGKVKQDLQGARVEICTPDGHFEVHTPLVGGHNLQNLLGAVGAALALGVPVEAIQRGLSAAAPIPGRMEPVSNDKGLGIFVDYAHTPDALAKVLKELGPITKNDLWVVFGAGGDRDTGKRSEMGAIAARLADRIVLTTDNPRTEDPQKIIDDIHLGVPSTSKPWVELSRRRAIELAISEAQAGDVILIAGKGHETYQEVGKTRFPFDDREVARGVLAALDGGRK